MSKPQIKISRSLVERLVFLKYTLEDSLNYLNDTANEYGFTIGISLLHDSIENLFWAISQAKNISIKDNSILEKFETLHKSLGKKISFDKTSLDNLCKIRDSYKHHALLPNIPQTTSIIEKIIVDFYLTIKNIFTVGLESISMSSLISDQKLKTDIKNIEKLLYKNKKNTKTSYRNLLFKIGETYFKYFEKNFTHSSLRDIISQKKEKERYKFPERDVDEIALKHLELGLTPYLYWRFKNLVPTFGIDTETDQIVSKMDYYWGRENWTLQNVKFCLNWLINYALKRQWLYSNKQYSLNTTHRVQIVTPLKDIKVVLSHYDIDNNLQITSEFNLKAKCEYLGIFIYFIDGIWQDYKNNEDGGFFILYTSGLNYDGKIDKNAFKIKETYFSDIPDQQIKDFLSNASQVGKEISKEVVKQNI